MDFFQKPKILTLVIIGLLVINLGTLAFLWFHRPSHEFPMHHEMMENNGMRPRDNMKGFIEDRLNLTDKQREEFDKLREEHHKQIMPIQDSIRKEKDKLFEQLQVTTADSNLVNSLASAIGDNQRKMELLAFNHFQKVRSLCDDKQKPIFDEISKDIIKNLEMPMMQHMEMQKGPHGLPPPR